MQLREMLKLGENYLKMRNFSSREHTTEKKTTQGMEADKKDNTRNGSRYLPHI